MYEGSNAHDDAYQIAEWKLKLADCYMSLDNLTMTRATLDEVNSQLISDSSLDSSCDSYQLCTLVYEVICQSFNYNPKVMEKIKTKNNPNSLSQMWAKLKPNIDSGMASKIHKQLSINSALTYLPASHSMFRKIIQTLPKTLPTTYNLTLSYLKVRKVAVYILSLHSSC